MFTGIVQARCLIAGMSTNSFGARLVLDVSKWTPAGGYQPVLGDSICVSGVCLTLAKLEPGRMHFDVIAETLAKSSLGRLKSGDQVNVEPAVLPTQPMGGHFMQGHVDGVGTVKAIYDGADEWRTTITPPPALMPYIISKGSIAIDGVSLTIAAVHDDAFEVALIPTTLELTTLRDHKVGDAVNLEADIVAKTVVAYLQKFAGNRSTMPGPTLTMEQLRDAGLVN